VVHTNRFLIIVIGDDGYTTPSLSVELSERTKVVGVYGVMRDNSITPQ
jgi:hypothetical protein